jgi:hypothetical protein
MAEFEELRLTVTLIDNASQGMAVLRQNLRILGGAENREALAKISQSLDGFGERLTTVRDHMGKTASAAQFMSRAVVSGMATLATAFISNFAVDSLKKFTDEVMRMNALSAQIGISGGAIKNIVDQLSLMGVDSGAANKVITDVTKMIADLSRLGSKTRESMMKGAISDPEAMREHIQRLVGLGSKGEIGAAINEVVRAYQSVVDEEFKATKNHLKAAALGGQWLASLGLDPSTITMIEGKLKDVTAAQDAAFKHRAEIAKQFSRQWAMTTAKTDDFIAGLQTGLLPLMTAVNAEVGDLAAHSGEWIGGALGKFADDLAEIGKQIELWKQGHYWEAIKRAVIGSSHLTNVDPLADGATPPADGRDALEWGEDPKKMSYRGGDSMMPPVIKASLGGGDPINVGGYSRSGAQGELARAIRAGVFGALVDFRDSMKTGGAGGGGGGGGMPGVTKASYSPGGGGGGGGGARPGGGGDEAPTNSAGPMPSSAMIEGDVGPAAALAIAKQHLNDEEIRDQAKLTEFFKSKGIRVNPASTAWCAAFVNANLAAAGVKGTGSLAAGSFTGWGKGVEANQKIEAGDVGVVRGRSPRTGIEGTHVGQLTGKTEMRNGVEYVEMIAGNDGNRVRYTMRPRSSLHVRRATDEMIAEGRKKLDGSMANETNSRTEAKGKLSADVTAPPGTKVEVNGKGVFSKTETTRRTPINSEAPAVST